MSRIPSARSTARERRNDPAQVWRDGGRIRRGDSTGYADTVPDETIWQHIAEDVANRDLDSATFRGAVLRLRAEEAAIREHRAVLDDLEREADALEHIDDTDLCDTCGTRHAAATCPTTTEAGR